MFFSLCDKSEPESKFPLLTVCLPTLPAPLSGKTVKKEPEHDDGHQHFDEAAKLLQEFQETQVDRVGSRPSSNLSSLSNASERDQHHLGKRATHPK